MYSWSLTTGFGCSVTRLAEREIAPTRAAR